MVSSQKRRRSRMSSGGFTLIELLVVLAILTMLAGLVGPRVLGMLGGAKSKTAAVQISRSKRPLRCTSSTSGVSPHRKKVWMPW